jgi:hypothetical protein
MTSDLRENKRSPIAEGLVSVRKSRNEDVDAPVARDPPGNSAQKLGLGSRVKRVYIRRASV